MASISSLLGSGHLWRVLVESYRFVIDQPLIFAPRLFSTLLSSFWMIGLISGYGSTVLYLAAFPFIALLGMAVLVMVAGMVKEPDNVLEKGFETVMENWKGILKATLLVGGAGFLFSLPASVGVTFYLLTGNFAALVSGLVLTGVFMFLFVFVLYFFPIALVENRSLFEGLADSRELAFSNSREVGLLTVFSFALLGVAFFMQGYFETLGYIGFIAGRLISAAVSTYLLVVSHLLPGELVSQRFDEFFGGFLCPTFSVLDDLKVCSCEN